MNKPNKYHNSVIYKIWKDNLIYIGSTTNFKIRMRVHKRSCNNEKSKDYNLKIYQTIRLNGGWDSFKKEIIEQVSCESKKELNKIEGEYIKNIGNLNVIIAGRTDKEYREDNKEKIREYKKQYYEDNRERLRERHKIYYEDNREKIRERKNKYYEDNGEKFREKRNKYYEDNREKIIEKAKIKINCPICNRKVRQYEIKRHQRTKICKSFQI